MDFSGKNLNFFLIHVAIVFFLILYLISADLIFNTIIHVPGESRCVSFPIPDESNNIKYVIESDNTKKLEWKTVISITGWAFINGENASNQKKYVAFLSENSTYIYEALSVQRPDVNKTFKSPKINYLDSGFFTNIPIYNIPDGNYKIGIILKNETTTSFTKSENGFMKNEDRIISGYFSEMKNPLTITTTNDFKYNIEETQEIESGDIKVLSISGWAFIPDYKFDTTKKYVVLSSENLTYTFDTFSVKRPDVANNFDDNISNVMDSGFHANIPRLYLKNGTYVVGIIISGNGETFQKISNIKITIPEL